MYLVKKLVIRSFKNEKEIYIYIYIYLKIILFRN